MKASDCVGTGDIAANFNQDVCRFGATKSKTVVVNRDDAGSARTQHSHVGAGPHTHLMQPSDDVRLAVHFHNRGRGTDRQEP